ncbi:MAG: P-loop NTPase fold protein [Ignavibacteria bacterium]
MLWNTPKDSRLVVFIDDLDRCLPEKALGYS